MGCLKHPATVTVVLPVVTGINEMRIRISCVPKEGMTREMQSMLWRGPSWSCKIWMCDELEMHFCYNK